MAVINLSGSGWGALWAGDIGGFTDVTFRAVQRTGKSGTHRVKSVDSDFHQVNVQTASAPRYKDLDKSTGRYGQAERLTKKLINYNSWHYLDPSDQYYDDAVLEIGDINLTLSDNSSDVADAVSKDDLTVTRGGVDVTAQVTLPSFNAIDIASQAITGMETNAVGDGLEAGDIISFTVTKASVDYGTISFVVLPSVLQLEENKFYRADKYFISPPYRNTSDQPSFTKAVTLISDSPIFHCSSKYLSLYKGGAGLETQYIVYFTGTRS